MKVINSVNNEYIKKIKKLHVLSHRQEQQQYLIEGFHLVNEALSANVIKTILVTEQYYQDYQTFAHIIIVSEEIIKKLSTTQTPQAIIGICQFQQKPIDFNQPVLVLDDLQEPGNLGTLIRTALGFNIKNIVVSNNNVDFYNAKVVRSTQGAIFKVNLLKTDLPSFIIDLKAKAYQIYTTFLHDDKNNNMFLEQANFSLKTCLILGNEAKGINQNLLTYSDFNINILTYNNLESLNVAIAGAIIMHKIFSQIFFAIKL